MGGFALCKAYNDSRGCSEGLSCSKGEHRCDILLNETSVCGDRHSRLEHMELELPAYKMNKPAAEREKEKQAEKVKDEATDDGKRQGPAKKRKADAPPSRSSNEMGGPFCQLCGNGAAAEVKRWQGHSDWKDVFNHAVEVINSANSDGLMCPLDRCSWSANPDLPKGQQEASP